MGPGTRLGLRQRWLLPFHWCMHRQPRWLKIIGQTQPVYKLMWSPCGAGRPDPKSHWNLIKMTWVRKLLQCWHKDRISSSLAEKVTPRSESTSTWQAFGPKFRQRTKRTMAQQSAFTKMPPIPGRLVYTLPTHDLPLSLSLQAVQSNLFEREACPVQCLLA